MMRREVRNELRTGDYDLVQCEYLHTLNFIPDLRRYPSLLTHHEVLSLVYERLFRRAASWTEKISAFLKWRLMRVYERRLCRKVRSVVALSAVDRDYLNRRLKVGHACLAQSGVDVDFFRARPDVGERPDSLIFVGFFKHPPNVQGMSYFFREIWPGILQERAQRHPDRRRPIGARPSPGAQPKGSGRVSGRSGGPAPPAFQPRRLCRSHRQRRRTSRQASGGHGHEQGRGGHPALPGRLRISP